jgi:hypothetical protein
MIVLLAAYDKAKGTNLSSRAASTYLSIVSAVATQCDGSLAAKIVSDAYIELLRQYIRESDERGYAENSNPSADSQSNRNSICEECNKSFRILDLPIGASDEEVMTKKHAFAELFHADRLAAMSDNARRIALEQHQNVNHACDHILRECNVRMRTDGGIHDSESPRARYKPTSATKAQEKAKHQTTPASSSVVSNKAKPKNGHTVPTDEELIEALDATRRRVEESTRKTEEFLDEMKKRKQRSLERL